MSIISELVVNDDLYVYAVRTRKQHIIAAPWL